MALQVVRAKLDEGIKFTIRDIIRNKTGAPIGINHLPYPYADTQLGLLDYIEELKIAVARPVLNEDELIKAIASNIKGG